MIDVLCPCGARGHFELVEDTRENRLAYIAQVLTWMRTHRPHLTQPSAPWPVTVVVA